MYSRMSCSDRIHIFAIRVMFCYWMHTHDSVSDTLLLRAGHGGEKYGGMLKTRRLAHQSSPACPPTRFLYERAALVHGGSTDRLTSLVVSFAENPLRYP